MQNPTRLYSLVKASLVSHMLAQVAIMTAPNYDGASHTGNWPSEAVFGVDHTCHDRQFPNVVHERSTDYFNNVSELLAWLQAKREWIAGTDYDFSMNYTVYVWDWGPQLKYSKSM